LLAALFLSIEQMIPFIRAFAGFVKYGIELDIAPEGRLDQIGGFWFEHFPRNKIFEKKT
jgi:hypothetical protein